MRRRLLLLALAAAAACPSCDTRPVTPADTGAAADALPSPDLIPDVTVRLDTRPVLLCTGSKLSDLQVCLQDSDCAEVSVGCCNCANGGVSTTVHKSCITQYEKRFRMCPDPASYGCATVYLCGAPPRCTAGLCKMPN